MRHINEEGLAAIKRFESLRLRAYKDSVGVPTIGYGHTRGVSMGQTITEAQADNFLREDLQDAEAAVERLVKVPLTDGQFAALVSFTFNVGGGALAKSTLLKKLNARDYNAVPHELMKYKLAGGRVLPGLANRRAAEAGLWAKGSFVSSSSVPAEPVKPPVVTAAHVGATAMGTGALAATVKDAVTSLQPAADTVPVIKYVIAAMIVFGVLLTFYGLWTQRSEEAK